MPVISSLFLVAALVLAVVIGPQTRPWSWGPSMMALGIATLAALPCFWRRGKASADFGVMALGVLTAGWFAWRATLSPVAELGQADLLLIGATAGAFISIRAIAGNPFAERILGWGIALLLLANIGVMGRQIIDPSFSPLFGKSAGDRMISGFFAHYNETANFLIASVMLVLAGALRGRHAPATRFLWVLVALAGLAGVWFTRSRGGILGAAIASGVFAILMLISGKRRKAKWFAPAIIGIPLIALAIGAFLLLGWHQAQQLRQAGSGVAQLLDNNCRLYFLGIALSCVGLHPMAGGGSRSFSWECFRFVDGKSNGDIITHKPEFVHNELIQSATDYGLLGAALLIAVLVTLVFSAFLRICFEPITEKSDWRDQWRIGAIAAFAGMLVQSSFSFVFHLMPGILLLGICLGQMSRTRDQDRCPRTIGTSTTLSLAAIGCAFLMLTAGWRGAQVTHALWPTHFSKQAATSAESQIDALGEAIRIWPQSTFYQERATLHQTMMGAGEKTGSSEPAKLAISDYQQAATLHPYDPGLVVNIANIQSQLQQDVEAEESFAKAIQLQGGMEPGFRAHLSLATHHLRKGLRLFDPAAPERSLDSLELAAEQMETAVAQMHWITPDMIEPRVSIHESLGTAREASGDRDGALQCYNLAAGLEHGARAHYRAAVLIGKMAVEAWSKRRPSEALMRFMEARKRVGQAGNELPEGVKPSQRAEYVGYLDQTIEFLKGARVEPGMQH